MTTFSRMQKLAGLKEAEEEDFNVEAPKEWGDPKVEVTYEEDQQYKNLNTGKDNSYIEIFITYKGTFTPEELDKAFPDYEYYNQFEEEYLPMDWGNKDAVDDWVADEGGYGGGEIHNLLVNSDNTTVEIEWPDDTPSSVNKEEFEQAFKEDRLEEIGFEYADACRAISHADAKIVY